MDGKSLDVTAEKIGRLKEIIPEAFTENKIDWEKLKAALGDDIEFKNERYVLNWAGKSDAFRALQAPSTDTLFPCKEESINFDSTGNIFIEGENLEVLKVLQKAYFGKIKMIYIDPPYNTGNDTFIYPDRFSESKEEYLGRIGDKDEMGLMTREGLFRKNSKDSGHYHSNWLSMMYPRLFLARNLLRDDGVIFVSIDDNEVHNLRLLMNEVFGEENFIGCIVRATGTTTGQGNNILGNSFDYLLTYSKNPDFEIGGLPLSEKDHLRYNLEDENGKFSILQLRRTGNQDRREDRPNMFFPIESPDKTKVYPKGPTGYDSRWRVGRNKYDEMKDKNLIYWKKNERNEWTAYFKYYLEGRTKRPSNLWKDIDGNKKAQIELKSLFDSDRIFDTPKPTDLVRKSLQIATLDENDIILDFFAGSCTTAHAVLALNKEDGGNRKFICAQLPEKCDENSEAFKAGYKTIAEIGKERIRRVIKKMQDVIAVSRSPEQGKGEAKQSQTELPEITSSQAPCNDNIDLGFKVFKLKESNFKIWRSNIETEEELIAQMQQHLEPLDERAKTEDVLYELLIKSGVQLTAKIKEQNGYIIVNNNEIALMLEKADDKIIKQIIAVKPQKVFTLDRLFKNNDKLKTNTALQMKDAGIEFKAI